MRFLSRTLLAGTAACALAIAVAACGTASAPAGAGPGPRPGAKVDLAFRTSARPGSASVHKTLRCDPLGGTVTHTAAACRVLLRMRHNPFTPRPKRTICPMIMEAGGQIVVTGTWFGQPVHRVVIDGECDIALFGVLHRILS
jgi:hypothetical protein